MTTPLEEIEVRLEVLLADRPRTPLAELVAAGPSAATRAWDEAHPEVLALVREAEALRDAAAKEAQRAAWAVNNWQAAQARLPNDKRLRKALEALRETPGTLAAKAWDFTARPLLVLSGGLGTGKSVAAAVAAKRVVTASAARTSLRWVRCEEEALEDCFGPAAKARRQTWEWAGVLVVDDLGAERRGDAWVATIAAVLTARVEASRPTIVTTNLAPADVRRLYGARYEDRWHGAAEVQELTGASLRRAT